MKNNYGEIDIMDAIEIDKSEYDSYEEATITAEMLSLQNVRVEKCNGKYKLIPCSEAMDCTGKHLKVGDKVQYGLQGTWEITGIERGDPMHIYLKSGEHKEYVYAFKDKEGYYTFSGLKLGKISARHIVSCILASISEASGKVIAVMFIILICVICVIALKVMFEYL